MPCVTRIINNGDTGRVQPPDHKPGFIRPAGGLGNQP